MTIYLTLFSALTLMSSLSGAQTDQRSAADAAKAFSLDLPAANAPAAVSDPDAPPSVPAVFTLDTPISQIIADPKAKVVLDTDLPGLSTDTNLAKFQSMSLRQFQPMTGGQMTDALLAKTGADLAAIAPSPVLAHAPASVPRSPTSRKVDNGR
ncbi:hypothetical protein [uncultured Sphingomonas sp.]|uniref:hypothetical protein n=1 Tax=uncultured Sphingomonas sp. TaxID=158754 RepID=UPI0035CB01DE